LSILSLVPFSSQDEQYARAAERLALPQREPHLVSSWRAKLFRVGNSALAKIADALEIPFIERGIDYDGTALATSGLLIDGIHLGPEARDRSAVAIINAIGRLPRKVDAPKGPRMYQVTLDKEMSNFGVGQMTVGEDSFASIQDVGSGVFCKLRDINTDVVFWVNRTRIAFVLPVS
jgi:hypothetical protein